MTYEDAVADRPAVISRRDARVCVEALELALRLNDLLADTGHGTVIPAPRAELERIMRELGGGS